MTSPFCNPAMAAGELSRTLAISYIGFNRNLYLKSFFLLLPSIYSAVEGLRITLKNQYDIINDYKSKMDKFTKSADFQEAYNSLVKIDESQINNLNSKITSQNHKLNDYRGKLESLNIKLNKIKDILK